jgi:integrin alpha FG-GAP repeat containing protein 1
MKPRKMRQIILLVLSIQFVDALFGGLAPQRYVEEKLIDAGSLGLPETGLVAAFGDYNGDQVLDLFHLSADQRSLSVYIWDKLAYSWIERVDTRIRTDSDFIITNVVPNDYNYDGRLDILLMGAKDPGSWWGSEDELDMRVYLQQSNATFCESCCEFYLKRALIPMIASPQFVNASTAPQPIPFDASGDMRTDLLGFSPNQPLPQIWNNVWESSNQTNLFSM